ncbi:hypothetical protein CDAR_498981 [Caerostris darwini]|uniref:Uncharacterized protein n=1 Tax=Caerostris darwini TaxID=1538125 RepID=A0AAV4T1Q1_9ARAC|nr:hypothetical protein CDAR_498981 [Caerostris darwini]
MKRWLQCWWAVRVVNSRPLAYISEHESLTPCCPSMFLQAVRDGSSPDIDDVEQRLLNRRFRYRQTLYREDNVPNPSDLRDISKGKLSLDQMKLLSFLQLNLLHCGESGIPVKRVPDLLGALLHLQHSGRHLHQTTKRHLASGSDDLFAHHMAGIHQQLCQSCHIHHF